MNVEMDLGPDLELDNFAKYAIVLEFANNKRLFLGFPFVIKISKIGRCCQ